MRRLSLTLLGVLITAPSLVSAQDSTLGSSNKSLVIAAQEAKVSLLITEAERHFRSGLSAYQREDYEKARSEFDASVDVILEGRLDVRSTPRLREYFSDLLTRIQKLEAEALAAGKGASEQRYLPAIHDELANLKLDQENTSSGSVVISTESTSELELEDRPEIRQYIDYFTRTKRGRKTMARGLQRSGKYLRLVQEIFQEEGVPVDLVWHGQAESNWQLHARSRARAVGIWQFVSWRAREYGLTQNRWIDERSSLEQAARASAQYLRFLHDRFLDWKLALAAYNCGENRVDQAIAASGYADFWYLSKHKLLPRETRNHVPIILAIITVAKHREKYGFGDIETDPQIEFDTVRVHSKIDLRLVAEMTNTPYETIEELNPELKRGVTPPNMEYNLRLPVNTRQEFAALLERIPTNHRESWRVIRVKANESLGSIAEQNDIRAEQIAQVNGLTEETPLDPGRALILPLDAPRTPLRGRLGRHGQQMARRSTRRLTITIRPGDTLSGIAARYGVSVRDLARLNNISRRSILRIGQRLVVNAVPNNRDYSFTEGRPRTYRVRSGDSLYTIGRRYGVSVPNLKAWNRLRNNRIFPGQRLLLRPRSHSRATSPAGGQRSYVVRPGETLSGISRRTGVSIATLRRWNNLSSDKIYAGQRLVIKRRKAPRRTQRRGKKLSYVVRPGDTLSVIAQRHEVSTAKLMAWNRLHSDKILVGQRLTIHR